MGWEKASSKDWNSNEIVLVLLYQCFWQVLMSVLCLVMLVLCVYALKQLSGFFRHFLGQTKSGFFWTKSGFFWWRHWQVGNPAVDCRVVAFFAAEAVLHQDRQVHLGLGSRIALYCCSTGSRCLHYSHSVFFMIVHSTYIGAWKICKGCFYDWALSKQLLTR